MIEIIWGVVATVVIIVLFRVLSKVFTTKLIAAAILVAIAFIYVGFSLKQNPVGHIILECSVALGFSFIAMIGYTKNNSIIAYGIILHGIWDIFHHNGLLIRTDIPPYWPVFCLTIDFILGLYLLVVFKNPKAFSLLLRNPR
jgi:hypothetical protein